VADIFISYTSSDSQWAHCIANELRELGHTPHVYEWEIKAGDDIYAWMEQHHDAADHGSSVEYGAFMYSSLTTHRSRLSEGRDRLVVAERRRPPIEQGRKFHNCR